MNLREEIETAVAQEICDISPLSGGCIGQVYRVRLQDGEERLIYVLQRNQRGCR